MSDIMDASAPSWVERRAERNAPKHAEAIPAVTRPVKMPRLVPGRVGYVVKVATGAVLFAINVAGLVFYFGWVA